MARSCFLKSVATRLLLGTLFLLLEGSESWNLHRTTTGQHPLAADHAVTTTTTTSGSSRRDILRLLPQVATTVVAAVATKPTQLWAAPSSKTPSSPLARRLEQDILVQPPTTAVVGEAFGVDNFYYPDFLAGTWNVTQTLVSVQTPLGPVFLGGPNGNLAIAEQSVSDSQSRVGVPIGLQLRYVPTPWGVAEDRVFNTAQRLNAFAGRNVVVTAEYADVGASNRAKVLSKGGTETTPLTTVFVRFKGPAAQKTFVTAHTVDPITTDDDLTTMTTTKTTTWTGSESLRSIFALTNQNTAPPIFTDTETLWQFTTTTSSPNLVQGRLRIASYLNAQQDKLYFEAKQQAVSLLDYDLRLERVD